MVDDPRRDTIFSELKRRHVYRAGAIYIGACFVVWQVADIVSSAFALPQVVMRAVVIGAVLGLPIVLALAWIYELTPSGLRTTASLDAEGRAPNDAAGSAPPSSRRPLLVRVGTSALVVLVVLSGSWWIAAGRLSRPPAEPADLALAVFPFSVRGGTAMEYLREGVVDLLSRNLSGSGDLEPLEPTLVMRAAAGAERLDLVEAREIARRIGAGRFVLGTVSQAGPQIRIDATIHSVGEPARLPPTHTVQGDTAQLFQLLDQLTAELLAEASTGAASRRFVRTAALTTASLPALKAYLEGERSFRLGEHSEGVDAFRRALAIDSSFVLARYRLAISHHMRGEHDVARRESERALGQADRLGSHERRVIEAFHAYHEGRVGQAERLLDALLTEYPRDLEARLILAELYVQYAGLRGQSLSEARRHLESIVEADPQFACIYCQLAWVSFSEGDLAQGGRWLRRAGFRTTGDTTVLTTSDRFTLGFFTRDASLIRSARVDLDTLPDAGFRSAAQAHIATALATGNFPDADDLMDEVERRGGDPRIERMIRAYAAGQYGDAAARARSLLDSDDANLSALAWHLTVHAPFEARDAPYELLRERMKASLIREGATARREADDASDDALVTRTWSHLLLGLLASRSSDAATAHAHADSISRLSAAAGPHLRGLPGLAGMVRADVALRTGEPAVALRELESIGYDVAPHLIAMYGPNGTYVALLRARTHAALGQHTHAHRWLRSAIRFGMPLPAQHAAWHRDMAAALQALGRNEEAQDHLRRSEAATLAPPLHSGTAAVPGAATR